MYNVINQDVSTIVGTREKILKRAEELFLEYGYSKTRMEEIARTLRMSRKTLYKHFENKAHLFSEMIRDKNGRIVQKVEETFRDETSDVLEKIRTIGEFKAREFPPGFSRVYSEINLREPELFRTIPFSGSGKIYERILELFSEGIEKGRFRSDIDPRIFASLLDRSLEAVLVSAELPRETSNETVLRTIYGILFYGIMNRS
ncbi:TetR/AcrR family transcriptional regulator [Leptospira gomenensis]|uniref:TetR/AcrR family transcriptional regulator n=1 Tax=Leptospira gomenensis TaxID=2484974 RepID=A0A5F1YI54_9LEPT|nr:TetR/AcrR family transcriptional regulator [Leptospira gomenensis]TGK34496.1 TetR/AcrR family transcriptional regulator [Leptospira gomenensis]TGK40194.1 TetR/AcrR family transcriptional regulator [Leptospira gomenensis]TGK41881.1 TetR/AcrR family transcriptional regulator [Leptospira gomenensis]TGK55703.1 TetR/AcrR family transcriptional regulator [Leptospira gomenensis]